MGRQLLKPLPQNVQEGSNRAALPLLSLDGIGANPANRRSIMAEDDYVLSHTADASERERLGLLERQYDPLSQRHLAALGIQQGWRCLEVGAGHGSIARWLAEQTGPQGRVVATDINSRFLREIELPNLEVRQHDIRIDPLESATYDLAHRRGFGPHARTTPCGPAHGGGITDRRVAFGRGAR